MRAESRAYAFMCSGEDECSNTLEDEDDTELPGQALIFLPARQHIYSLLLESAKGKRCAGISVQCNWSYWIGLKGVLVQNV